MTEQPLIFWASLAAGALALLLVAYLRRLRWRPAWPLRFAFLALVLLAVFPPQAAGPAEALPPREVLVLDRSDSITPADLAESEEQARLWLQNGRNRLVVLVGAQPAAVAGEDWPALDGRATDLAGGIRMAADFIAGSPGRILLATDGFTAEPLAAQEAIAEAMTAAPEGSDLDIGLIPLESRSSPADAFTGPLYLPSAMWENTPFTVVLPVTLGEPTEFELVLAVNEQIVVQETLSLPVGQHLVPFNLETGESEIMTFTAIVDVPGDPRPENNVSSGSMQVFPAPAVLIVTENASRANLLAVALAQEGIESDLMRPEDLPTSLREMEFYQAVILHNFLASSLDEARMLLLKQYVQQMGRGLIFTGGRNAYTLGGYKDTVLEAIMPVQLAPPPRTQKSPLTFVLAFDRSASMGPLRQPVEQRPITLAREAAIRSVETLGAEDFLGILTYNTSAEWTIPLGPVGDGLALQQTKDAIGRVDAAGGTSIFEALSTAVTALIETPTVETRHLLLLSDGQSADGTLPEFVALARTANDAGITISTIALGATADQVLMEQIAAAGKGRFYPVLEATDLPRILIDESEAARGENVHEGLTFSLQGESDHPVLSGFTISTLPALQGYNALASKATLGAEDVLVSADFEDPLLSVWQVGLGRVAAWTGDFGEEWAADWIQWEGWGRLWAQLVRYTLPDPSLRSGRVSVEVQPDGVQVSAQVLSAAGVPRNGVQVEFAYVDPQGQTRLFAMPQAEPGLYRMQMERPPEGVYRGVVRYQDESGFPVEQAAALAVNYSPEWQPAAPDQAVELSERKLTWADVNPAQAAAGDASEESFRGVLQTLLIALILLWPVEIAVRRRWMPWR